MKLADFQSRFADSLLHGNDEGLTAWVRDDRFPPESLVEIYRDSVFASLVSVLRDTLPDLRGELGEADFSEAARAFIRTHPPAGPCLHEYGADFRAFVAVRMAE